ncbi:helix-turn-helix domain-containing protein [Sneathiella sp. P13V-1]|uniref:AraC family transcriptional regulator n=1 Tax=Sneathiella sp. P13V-1 TaxID=2697366 RepID=UPI00187BADAC|nr:AraC family transcriptional regulator [Sneathiella sp. P13V-1]MBE7638683.1 helix-turn-helix domain-containing protein [Sneathiella sp. P13V-1]
MSAAVRQLEKLIDLVANYELDEISVARLSEDMRLSRWQLQRTFLALTTTSLGEYLRAYKLSRGAEMLIGSDTGILDIAIACGFNSQEAFTRSFKERFKMTPRQYRLNGKPSQVSFELFIPKTREWSKAMNIELKTKPELKLKGHMAYFNGHGMEGANNFEVIPNLWDGLNRETMAQDHNVATWYGYIFDSDQREKGQLLYLAGYDAKDGDLEISNVVEESVPEQLYAVLPHYGPLEKLGESLDAFYGEWLPSSGYKMSASFNIEVYDQRFDPTSANSYFETWVPVKAA